MLHLDVRTIIVASALSALALALALYVASRSFTESIDGMRRWAWGCALQSLGWALLATQGHLPEGISMVLANTLIVGSIALCYHALCEFTGHPFRRALPLTCVATVALDCGLLTYIWPSLPLRIVICSVANSLLFFVCARTILRYRPAERSGSYWWTGIGFVLVGVGGIARTIATLVSWPTTLLLTNPDPIHGWAAMGMFLGVVALPFGFLLMCNERCHAELRRLASQDVLTGSFNRGTIDRCIDSAWLTATRTRAPLAVILLDVDHFKRINDTYGHPAGDRVLRHVADLIRCQLRAGDMVGRYGGEEFIVVLPNTALDQARLIGERIRREIEAERLLHLEIPVGCTLSGGVATLQLQDRTAVALVQRADTALYAAKRGGRNRIVTAA